MQYTTLVLTILASLAAAQNAFTMTTLSTITAGTPYNITWSPSTDGTVTLILRQGSSTSLDTVETIAPSIPNSGSYTWTPSPTLPAGSDYAFEIVSDSNKDSTNYSGHFALDSSGTGSSSSSAAASSSATDASATTLTGSSTSSATEASVTTTTGSSSSASSRSGTSTGGSSSELSTSTESGSASGKETSTGSGSQTTAASKTSSGTSSGTSSSSTSAATGNAAVVLKAGGTLLGFVGVVMAAL